MHTSSVDYIYRSIALDIVRTKKMRHRGCRPGDQQLTFATNHHHMSFSLLPLALVYVLSYTI